MYFKDLSFRVLIPMLVQNMYRSWKIYYSIIPVCRYCLKPHLCRKVVVVSQLLP